tara:strand:+ start:125 stop:1093 length:969 start_codon:yes stop_codon:yes gene_type:complete
MKIFKKFLTLFALSFLIGCSSSSNESTYKEKTNLGSSCNWEIWEKANAICLGEGNCAGRTYNEMSGGDITGGLDCVASTFERKMKSAGIDLKKNSIPENSKEIRWNVQFPSYFIKKARELHREKGQERIVLKLSNKIIKLAENNSDRSEGYNYKGIAKSLLKDYRGSLKAFDKALEIETDPRRICNVNRNKAYNYRKMRKFDLSIKTRLISIEKQCKLNKEDMYEGYYFIADLYFTKKKDWEKTIFYANKALDSQLYLNAQVLKADSYLKLGQNIKYCSEYRSMANLYVKAIKEANWTGKNVRTERWDNIFEEASEVCGDLF